MSARVCGSMLHMYDGEYEGDCELEAGHSGAHWDGTTSWRTVDGSVDWDSIDLPEDRWLFVEPAD